MAKLGTKDLHDRATNLVVKALEASNDQRIALVHEVMAHTDLSTTDLKKIQEAVRKVCALRDQIAINLYDTSWQDPRQFTMDFTDWRPEQFE